MTRSYLVTLLLRWGSTPDEPAQRPSVYVYDLPPRLGSLHLPGSPTGTLKKDAKLGAFLRRAGGILVLMRTGTRPMFNLPPRL